MSRIIPQMNKQKNTLPKWLDKEAILKAGKEELAEKRQMIQKVSSREAKTVIASYICQKCSEILKADHKDILAQANMNTRAGVPEKSPICMKCGSDLQPYDTIAKIDNEPSIRYADLTEKRTDLAKEASDHGTTNSFVDRHLQYRAVDTLATYGRKLGMLVGRARYLKSDRTQQAGQEYSTLNNFECELEWQITPKLKRRVTATISYDPEGKFIMPRVFKTAEGKEYSFDKDTIKKLTTDVQFKNTSEPTLKKTDQMQFRKPDPSNFKAVASLNKDTGVDNEAIVERLTSESKKKVPEVDSKSVSNTAKVAELGETYQAPQPAQFTPPGQSTAPNQPAQFQPNTKVVNNLDGKVYNVVSNDPTKGVTVTDPTTNQQSVVPAQDAATNLKPALRTSSIDSSDVSSSDGMVERLTAKALKKDSMYPGGNPEVSCSGCGYTGTSGEFMGADVPYPTSLTRKCPKCGKLFSREEGYSTNQQINPHINEHESNSLNSDIPIESKLQVEPLVASLTSEAMNDIDRVTKEKSEDDDNIAEKLTESAKKYPPSMLRKIAMLHESRKNWQELRKEIVIGKPKKTVDPQSDFSRQTIAAKAMGFDPYKGKADKTGRDSKTLLPMGETEKIEVGMTEFPKDEEHDTHLNKGPIDEKDGYNLPFKKMDENQVEEREHFHNEDKLPIHNMRRDELADRVKGKDEKKNYGLNDDEERALRDTIGMKETPRPFVKRGYEDSISPELPIGEDAPFRQDRSEWPEKVVLLRSYQEGNKMGAFLGEDSDIIRIPKGTIGNVISLKLGAYGEVNDKWIVKWEGIPENPKSEDGSYEILKSFVKPIKWNADYPMLKQNKLNKTAADDLNAPKELPVKYNPDAKKAPASDAYKEPDIIPELSGEAKAAIEELHAQYTELQSLQAELAKQLKPFEEGMATLRKSMDPKMAEVAEKARKYMEIAFNEIATTEEGVFHFKDKIVTAYPEESAVGNAATVPQIIEEAKGISSELAEAVQKLRAIVENKNTSMVIRRFLTEFPISKGHEKKLGAIDETGEDLIDAPSALQQFVDSLRDFIISLKQSNLRLLQS